MIKRKLFSRNSAREKNTFRERGDTLVEVLLAISILSIVAISAMAVMNRGNALIQAALERTAVRAEINSQSEMLNYLRDTNTDLNCSNSATLQTLWCKIKTYAFSSSDISKATANCQVNPPVSGSSKGSFYLTANPTVGGAITSVNVDINPKGKNTSAHATADQTKGGGLWIDAVYYPTSSINAVAYYDFYIKACWSPIGSASGSQSQSLTIVRIYDGQ